MKSLPTHIQENLNPNDNQTLSEKLIPEEKETKQVVPTNEKESGLGSLMNMAIGSAEEEKDE